MGIFTEQKCSSRGEACLAPTSASAYNFGKFGTDWLQLLVICRI